MLLDVVQPLPQRPGRQASVLLISLHADPTTTVGAPENGGVTIYVRELAAALLADGWAVDVVTRRASDKTPSSEEYNGFRVLRVDAGPARHIPNDALAAHLPEMTEAVRALCAANDYALVSSHYWLSGSVGERIASEFGPAHVHTPHSHGVERRRRDAVTLERIEIERRLLRTTPIVTLSSGHIALYRERYGIETGDVHIVPAGVDKERFHPGDAARAREALGLASDGPWIGYVGRLTKEKGLDDLLGAFAELRKRGSNARLFVVGGASRNSRIPQLESDAAALGVADAVRFLGPIPNKYVEEAFRAADLIAVPSHYEAFGIVALEARASGVPIVASDVGGLRDLVNEENGGERVRAGDVSAWTDALERALRPETLHVRKARAMAHHDSGVLDWLTVGRRIRDIALHVREVRG